MHKKHLKIGIFTDDFFPKSGGVARSIELQLRELTEMGHEVVLFAPKTNFIPPDTCKSEGLPVWYVPGSESYLCSVKFGYKLALRIARQYKFDIIHSQNERGAMFLASRIAQILDVPHIHTFHSNYAGTHRTHRIRPRDEYIAPHYRDTSPCRSSPASSLRHDYRKYRRSRSDCRL